MTFAPKHSCRAPGCSVLLEAGAGAYCPPHTRAPRVEARRVDRFRGTAHERGYTSEWSRESKGFIAQFPICMGVLIPDLMVWTRTLAEQFHALRLIARERGQLLDLSKPGSGLSDFLEAFPIYRVEFWDLSRPATVVDHIIPHRGDPELFWAVWNWQPLTKRAHDRKTAKEDRPSLKPTADKPSAP